MAYPFYTEPTHNTGTITTGARDTAVSRAEGRLIVDAVNKVFMLQVNNHPLTTLLTMKGKRYEGGAYKGAGLMTAPAYNDRFDCFEQLPSGKWCKVSGTYSTGAVTITVTGAGSQPGYIFTVGDVFINKRTGERMKVDTVASTTTITVASGGRSLGATAAAAGADGDELFIIGNANEQGSSSRNVNMVRTSKVTNYTQIFRDPVSLTGTEKATKQYGLEPMKHLRMLKAIEHGEGIEKAFIFGEAGTTTGTNGKIENYTGGVLEHIESNSAYVQDQDGPLTAPDFNAFLQNGFTYGAKEKMLMCGSQILGALSEISRGQLQTVVGDSTYGVAINKWIHPQGTIYIVHNPFLVEAYGGYGFLLDMSCYRYRYMDGRDTTLKLNIQANDADYEADEYFTECGLERNLSSKCALIKNVTA